MQSGINILNIIIITILNIKYVTR